MKNEEEPPQNPPLNLESLEWVFPLQEILQEIPYYGIYICDVTGKVLFWNRGAEMLTGFTPEEVIGRSSTGELLQLIDSKGKALTGNNDLVQNSLEQGVESRQKIQLIHKTGHPLSVQMHFLPVKDRQGEITSGIVFFHDISKEEDTILTQKILNSSLKQYVSNATYREALIKSVSNKKTEPEVIDRTILFMDMVGFTAYAEKTTPGQVIRTLNDLLSLAGEAVRECRGDIDKFIGDCLVAVFSDPDNAVQAALQIRNGLFELNDRREAKGKKPIEVRIGINTGRLIRGEIGTLHRKELTVIGDVVNTAARVQTKAQPGEILITQATYDLIKSKRDCFPVGRVALKGKKQPVTMYRIGGLAKVELPWIPKFLNMLLNRDEDGTSPK
jgi:PAS domain S-box-containing protein